MKIRTEPTFGETYRIETQRGAIIEVKRNSGLGHINRERIDYYVWVRSTDVGGLRQDVTLGLNDEEVLELFMALMAVKKTYEDEEAAGTLGSRNVPWVNN